ncbi:hypothetical protein TNIN_259951 [Trichonephila inaurata madagascariensis]|uniref:Uncharacterized protein n=1 Tax=Trichonephila inaurata madagascariensis TaxID=2747483 RepID=A0A8X6WRF6_9ARAC|nr:hypothetical protein TNIN_259951 [Trichonephila inaurata madagascariensis]
MVKSRLPRSSEWRFNLFSFFPIPPSTFSSLFSFFFCSIRPCLDLVEWKWSHSNFPDRFPPFFPQPFYGRNRISSIRTGPEIRQGIVLFASDRPGSIRGTSKLC